MMAPSVLGRHTEMGYNNVALFLPYIAGGETIPLWIAATERNAKLLEVLTMAEVGVRFYLDYHNGQDRQLRRQRAYGESGGEHGQRP